MGALVAVVNKKGENASETAVAMLKISKPKNAETYGIASATAIKIGKTVDALQSRVIKASITIGYAFSKVSNIDRPQPVELENATLVFEGRIYPSSKGILDIELIKEKLKRDCAEAAEIFIKKMDGDFVFAVAEPERLIAGRDVMGVRPLYYGENRNLAALASERKALWKIGIEKTDSFPPGHVAIVDKTGLNLKPIKILTPSRPKQITLQTAAKGLQALLERSTKERVSGLKEVAVAFSGGLDSSIIAFLAKTLEANVHLIHVSLENQSEIDNAKKAAEELKLPIHTYLHNEERVEEVLQNVLWLIEEPDPVKTSIGIPVYWAAEKAAEMKFRVMLAGQGADELFGGYKRYSDDYSRYGSEKVRESLLTDIFRMYETNFERDCKICNFHNVELRLPFATYQIAKLATALPIELKIEPENTLRKLVLRQVAKNLGLPQLIVEKPKKAIQYTTGINRTLKKLAKRKGLSMNEYLQKMFQTVLKKMT
jgi:asparagine synthase (glutamine-hydrolysing)